MSFVWKENLVLILFSKILLLNGLNVSPLEEATDYHLFDKSYVVLGFLCFCFSSLVLCVAQNDYYSTIEETVV